MRTIEPFLSETEEKGKAMIPYNIVWISSNLYII